MTNRAMLAIALATAVLSGWTAISADSTGELRWLREMRS